MRLLADESLAGRTCEFLRAAGHQLLTLDALGRRGATNGDVLALAGTHHAIVVAEDRGFGNLREYPLGTHRGIIVLKIAGAQDIDAVHRHLRHALQTFSPEQLRGALLTVDPTKSRLRRPSKAGA